MEAEILFEFSNDRILYTLFWGLTSNGYQVFMNNDSNFSGFDNYPHWNYIEPAFLNSSSKNHFLIKIKDKNNIGKLKLTLIDLTKYYDG